MIENPRATVIRAAGALALVALIATSCSTESREVVLSASPGTGSAEVTFEVDGDRTTETITGPWEQRVEVSGNFSLNVSIEDSDGSADNVACSIAVAGFAPTTRAHPDGAECDVSGSINGGSIDISSFSVGIPAAEPDEPDEPDTASALPDEIVVTPVVAGGGAFELDLSNAWEFVDEGDFSPDGAFDRVPDAGFVEARELDVLRLEPIVSGTHLGDESVFSIERVPKPLAVTASLSDLIGGVSAQVNAQSKGELIALGLTEFAGVEAGEYVFILDEDDTDDPRTVSWYVFRAGTDLFVVSGVERGDAAVDELLASIRVVPEELIAVSQWTRLAVDAFVDDGWLPQIDMPADVQLVDELLVSDALDVSVSFLVFDDPRPMDEISAALVEAGGVESPIMVDGVAALVWEFVEGDRVTRRLVVPMGDALILDTSVTFAPEQSGIADEIFASITLT